MGAVRGWRRVGAVACRPFYDMRRKPSSKDRLDSVKRLLREKLEKRKSHARSLHIWHGCNCVHVACRWVGVRAGFAGARPDSSDLRRPGLNNLLRGGGKTRRTPKRQKESF